MFTRIRSGRDVRIHLLAGPNADFLSSEKINLMFINIRNVEHQTTFARAVYASIKIYERLYPNIVLRRNSLSRSSRSPVLRGGTSIFRTTDLPKIATAV